MFRFQAFAKWLSPGIGIKRWFLLIVLGIAFAAGGLTYEILLIAPSLRIGEANPIGILGGLVAIGVGFLLVVLAVIELSRRVLAPYREYQQGRVVDVVYAHSKRRKGLRVVAIGGGTGLPSVLRGMKQFTSNITAIVTVADDGGSSGRLRRELGVLPPGDLRNNIAALADDEHLMTRLFQYRFDAGDLDGHAFGNLFITALSGVTGSIESALVETARVLNIQGRVLPSTLQDVQLSALVRVREGQPVVSISGESHITGAGGVIDQISLVPEDATAYSESAQAVLEADLIVIGPGSLYTSILPNLLIRGIAEALRATNAYIVYVCNVATQPGETDGFTVAEHVMVLERHIGRGVFQLVLANNAYPTANAGSTQYVRPVPEHHEMLQRYEVRYTDLTDPDHPWRHHSEKLAAAILRLSEEERFGLAKDVAAFAEP
ncbi:MAG: YvcK family protein [Anaerolineae bacterium]|nr:YvcK family protein [Anaerolineae bacterium]